MAKTNKAELRKHITKGYIQADYYPSGPPGKTLFIEDGNATFHTLTDTFELIALKLLDNLSKCQMLFFQQHIFLIKWVWSL